MLQKRCMNAKQRTMKKLLKLTCGITVLASAPAFAAIAWVDMGDVDENLNSGVHGGVYWTTIPTNGATQTLTDSVSDVALTWTVGVGNIDGDSPNSNHSLTAPWSATTDGLWSRPGGSDQRLTVTISGLDATGADTYNLELFGRRSNSDDAAAIFHVQGAGALQSSPTVAQGNTTGTSVPYVFSNVQADGSGQIVIELQTPGGSDLSILTAMSIESVPEPSSTALLGLGGLSLLLRRKK